MKNIENTKNVTEDLTLNSVNTTLVNTAHKQHKFNLEAYNSEFKKDQIIPSLRFHTNSNVQNNTIERLSEIDVDCLPLDRYHNRLLKRAFDFSFSISFFLIIGWWLFPIIAILIKATTNGPVFFKQERWGLNNERIICYKFRTMTHGSPQLDQEGNFIQSSKNDKRVTKLGKYLRKFNIDEFPQFWNVLLGNMSVVGPRPHVTPLNLSYFNEIDNYLNRHLVKPGITGLAQVNGCRGETLTKNDMQNRVNHDLYYVNRWTFLLDCLIILKTVKNMIKGDENAY